ncbi:serine/threonine-protein kinase Nek6 [Elysia marginata]|uniref:non-specific serine/threonine protein kinase n=1 Tax=Elysia marginata TaxID=1093978 RepID=A0AAV4H6W9_9GAST|nr:serine/threonine-protein kinase Nek6 [Elysia marginata]
MAAWCLDYLAFSMPYYPGGDLVTVLDEKQEPEPATVAGWMLDVTLAVRYLHARGVAHNDIKPDNVFLDGSGDAHLGDLGLATEVTTESRTVLASSLMIGTPIFWPPERFQTGQDHRVDPFKSDIYAIGVSLWLVISWDAPGENVDYQARVRTATGLRMSDSLRSALEQLLEPDPAKRPTAAEAAELLLLASVD